MPLAQYFNINPNSDEKFVGLPVGTEQNSVEHFGYKHGLKATQIFKSTTSKDGRIWCLMSVGLACYDGVIIDTFGLNGELKNHVLHTIGVDYKNRLWLGSNLGIEVLDISEKSPRSLCFDEVGRIECLTINGDRALFGGTNGLFEKIGDSPTRLFDDPLLKNEAIKSVIQLSNGVIWAISASKGLIDIPQNSPARQSITLPKTVGQPLNLYLTQNHNILVSGKTGFTLLNAQGFPLFTACTGDVVTALCQISSAIWVGCNGRLLKYELSNSEGTAPELMVSDLYVRCINHDKDDNIWLSTDNAALCRISRLRHVYKTNIVPGVKDGYCITETPKGPLVGGTFGLRLPDGNFTLDGIKTWDCLVDNFGKIWSATQSGLYCVVNPQFNIPYKHESSEIYASPCRCLALNNNTLYVGSILGLARNTASGAEEILQPNGERLGYIYSLYNHPDGSLFIATLGNGLWQLTGDILHQIHGGSLSKKENVYSITSNNEDTLFIAHDNFISAKPINQDAKIIVETDEIVAAWSLNLLGSSQLIAGTSNGLVLYEAATGKFIRKLVGASSQTPWEFSTSRSVLVLDDSNILCGTTNGVNSIDTRSLPPPSFQPTAKCKNVKWYSATPELKDDVYYVPTGDWHLVVSVSTHWYADESECLMRIKLNGYEDDWSVFRQISDIYYTSLPKGFYTLDVQIYSPLAGLGPEKTLVSFHVV
ncbi:hypothetical protein DES40_0457 [Litorimonas taeanensis]|uniref:Two component regulator with propeller domain n=1 Tax=Litorimonas taeanensis TaxID=568099 RepID=A0A420WJP6_9PROT|nr:hypothetical protein [Litorimonas taeanensis]RKQ71146.1 hypothetical protein DES40_0457 [Litorimonas taeanensis]